MNYFIQINFAN